MATWTIAAGRSTTSALMRATWRATAKTTTTTTTTTTRISLSSPSLRPILSLRQPRISSSPPTPRLVRRELSSFLPLHTAIASSSLVSKLPADASASNEGRFANYLSPI